jgi:hypothetical protein
VIGLRWVRRLVAVNAVVAIGALAVLPAEHLHSPDDISRAGVIHRHFDDHSQHIPAGQHAEARDHQPQWLAASFIARVRFSLVAGVALAIAGELSDLSLVPAQSAAHCPWIVPAVHGPPQYTPLGLRAPPRLLV